MRKVLFTAVSAAALAIAVPASAAVIAGPTLDQAGSGWTHTGIQFIANQNATLTAFTYQNQGAADTIVLTDLVGNILQSLSTPAATTSFVANVNWALAAGQEYRLLQTVASNELFSFSGPGLVGNADISLTFTGLFGTGINSFSSNGFSSTTLWAGFNDITTVSGGVGAVPEPATWAMMLIGFAGLGYAARRRERAAA